MPDRYRVLPLVPGDSPTDITPGEQDWPFPDLPLVEMQCTAVTGDRAPAFREALANANEITRWHTGDGGVFTLMVRAVLPHEPDCPTAG